MSAVGQGTAWLGGIVAMIAGGTLLGGTLLVMNRKVHKPDEAGRAVITAMEVEKKKKPPAPKKMLQPKPKPRPSRRSPAPRPMIAANLAGLGVGIPMFASNDMGQLADGLLDDQAFTKEMILTEEAVDSLPEPSPSNATPRYPARARAKGVEGRVTLRLVIGADGRVLDAKVKKAEPAGVFEESALEAARTWTFEPAVYNGVPVQMALEMPLVFALN